MCLGGGVGGGGGGGGRGWGERVGGGMGGGRSASSIMRCKKIALVYVVPHSPDDHLHTAKHQTKTSADYTDHETLAHVF